MSFRSFLGQAKSSAEGFVNQHRNQHNNNAGAPPIPPNKPTSSSAAPYWAPTFDASTPVSSNFEHKLGDHGWGNNELQNYVSSPANSYHDNGTLVLRAIAANGKYTSARLKSHAKLSKPRGSLRLHARPPCAQGIWPAFWLLPSEPFTWPNDGEVDILETWNADLVNHSCLHWGFFNGQDHDKHRVVDTSMPDMASASGGYTYEFVWEQPEQGQGGKMLWYIDGRAVMKASIPGGTRPMPDWNVIINVAMGGDVCQGKTPTDGCYDFVLYSLGMFDEPRTGWKAFEKDWRSAPEGHMM